MIKLTDIYHDIINKKDQINVAVDMTCGHGYDTLILAKKAKKVYGFDIQSAAIKETHFRLKDFSHVILIHDNHELIDQYVQDKIDVAVFNLGYMPGGDLSIATEASKTLNALKKVIQMLNMNGLVILELYPHNPEEITIISDYASILAPSYDVLKINLLNKENAPFLIIIKKNR